MSDQVPGAIESSMWDADAIGNRGERVSHLYSNDLYHAHLSLYQFALPLARGAVVLDAGCGSGYGAAWLADHGAAFVHAIDVDAGAVAFSRFHFQRANLAFRQMDVARVTGIEPGTIGLVFCSNVLEHVGDVHGVLRGFHEILAPDGALVLAVPPVTDEAARLREILNPHHLNIWSQRQWQATLARFFGDVRRYTHHLGRTDVWPDFHNRPENTVIDASEFVFREVDAGPDGDRPDAMTLTALFVAREPLPVSALPPPGARPAFVDDSFTRQPGPGVALPFEVVTAPGRPVRDLPGAAWALVRTRGARALVDEARRYLAWRSMRREARRLLGPRR